MNLDKKRILWIDGLRGIACLCIFFHHWLSAFFYAAIVGEIQYVHTSNLMDMKFSRSPLSFWANGNFMVCIFCMVTGLVLTLQIMQVDHKHTAKVLIKRYFRLALPLFVVSAVVYLMLKYSLSQPEAAAAIDAAVEKALNLARTPDIWVEGMKKVSCSEMGDLVCQLL